MRSLAQIHSLGLLAFRGVSLKPNKATRACRSSSCFAVSFRSRALCVAVKWFQLEPLGHLRGLG